MTARFERVRETGSTNADCLARARLGEPDGLWLRADFQTAGRGRQGRGWLGDPANYAGSTILRLRVDDPPPATLAMVAGIALRAAVVRAGVADDARLLLKWPNDLLLDWAKVAGILLEREGDAVVAGFGVNLATAPPVMGRAVAALRDVMTPPDPEAFQGMLARAWDVAVAQWRAAPIRATLDAWEAVAMPRGTELATHDVEGQRIVGDFAGLADDGALRLRLADGSLKHVHAGDVLLAGEG